MTNEKLVELIKQGHNELMGDLYMQNKGVIKKLALQYQRDKNEFEDAMQDAYFGLVEAVCAYDESRGKFITCATWYISKAIRRRKSMIKPVPEWVVLKANKIKKIQNELTYKLDRSPTAKETAAAAGISTEDIKYTLLVVEPPQSIETPVTDDLTIADTIPDTSIDIENQIAELDYNERRKAAIQAAVNELSKTERAVITYIYFHNYTRTAAAECLNIDIKKLRQKEQNALSKLRSCKNRMRLAEYARLYSWIVKLERLHKSKEVK